MPWRNPLDNYVDYTKSKKKKKKPPKSSPRPVQGQTIEEWARQLVEKLYGAKIAGVESQKQAYLDDLRRQSDLELARGKEIASQIEGMNFPGRIQSIYGTAGDSIAALGQGFSAETGAIANRQAAEQTNMLSGTGQEGAVRNEGTAMGDVAYGLGGYLPARTMGETGAAFASDAALQPSFAMQDAGKRASEIYSEGLGGLTDFAMMLAEITGEKPEMIQQLMEQRREAVADAEGVAYERYIDDRDYALKMSAYYAAQGKEKLAEKWRKKAHQLDVRQQRRMENKDRGLDANGNPLPPKPDKKDKPKPVNWGGIQQDIAQDIPDLTKEVPDPDDYRGGTKTVKMSYQEAFSRLWTEYSGLVKNKGRLRRLINKLLAQNGIRKPSAPGASNTAPGTHSGDR